MTLPPPRQARPYAADPTAEASVTTILGIVAKPALAPAAARMTAERILDGAPVASVREATQWYRQVWDGRAATGTAVHAVMEAWANGLDADLMDVVSEIMERPKAPALWTDAEYVAASLEPYVDGLHAWWEEHDVEPVMTEYIVREPGRWIGTVDLWARVDGEDRLIDLKTTAEHDPRKGIYRDSWGPQLAAYALATELVDWTDDGPVVVGENPTPGDALVVHLRGDGRYEQIKFPNVAKRWGPYFTALVDAYHARKEALSEAE